MNLQMNFSRITGLLLLVVMALMFSLEANAQRNQSIYVEGFGSGLLYSVNYDTRLSASDKGLGLRLGAGVITGSDATVVIPTHLNYLVGSGKHKLELGLGITTILELEEESDSNDQHFKPSGTLMYRYQADSGLLLRAGLAPLFAEVEDDSIIPNSVFFLWPGVSIGYSW